MFIESFVTDKKVKCTGLYPSFHSVMCTLRVARNNNNNAYLNDSAVMTVRKVDL
jgi:hypothetical protein